ncbi:MAG: plasma-membrane proton-efflux P-type ATPase [Acidimicrobiia bacterium]
MIATDSYARQDAGDVAAGLNVDPNAGLTSSEATQRLANYGYNEIEEREEPLWHRILRRFWGPIPWMIEVASILSAVARKWEDFVIITIMLVVNAGIDFAQERRAMGAIAALKKRLAGTATVIRDGQWGEVPFRELVPGDVIRLRLGDIVPADLILLDGDYLLVDESAMTGESLPVSKGRSEAVYANTVIKQGEMTALVVNTGENTNFHSMVALVARAEQQEHSHFQKMVIRIGDFLIAITVVLVLVIIAAGIFRNQDPLELVRFSLVLAVAAIPVALPAVLSVTMAVGAMNLARQQAIVSRLVAIEELAGVDVLCSDKTGTLTRNEMHVAEPVVFAGHDERELFLMAALASRPENNDPIEMPIFEYADDHFPDLDWRSYRQQSFTPFDPKSKRTVASVDMESGPVTVTKGAPQVLLKLSQMSGKAAQDVEEQVDRLASEGYRTLAVGVQDGERLDLIGLVPLFDPPRDDSKEVLADLATHGVVVKMITGDNLAIAREIGGMLGLDGKAVRSAQLGAAGSEELAAVARIVADALYEKLEPDVGQSEVERFADEVADRVSQQFETEGLTEGFIRSHESDIVRMIEDVEIFAEVVPEDKYTIVDLLQKSGHFVAMTGDGVNDAPALKKADAGIAVSNATDAARAAADIVLTAPGLGVINEAIKQARITFERMNSYAVFRIAETLRIILFMTLAIVVFDFYPITALMIIVLALLNDIPILAIAYDNTRVDEAPVRWKMPRVLTTSSVLGVSGVASSFLLFFILVKAGLSTDLIQSLFFAKLVVAGHGTIYNTRIDDWFWRKPHPSRLLFGATFATRIIGTLLAVYGIFMTPIGWGWAGLMWAYAIVWFMVNDVVKMGARRFLRKRGVVD